MASSGSSLKFTPLSSTSRGMLNQEAKCPLVVQMVDEMRMKYVCMQVYEINKLQYIGYIEEEVKRLAFLPSPY
ncbi:Uncharacterized protein TPS_09880 [Trichinella pseudospiralis]